MAVLRLAVCFCACGLAMHASANGCNYTKASMPAVTVMLRSAYYRAGRLLRQHIPCDAVLAVTATATQAVQRSITAALAIDEANVVRDASMPKNLSFSITHLRAGMYIRHSARSGLHSAFYTRRAARSHRFCRSLSGLFCTLKATHLSVFQLQSRLLPHPDSNCLCYSLCKTPQIDPKWMRMG